MINLRGAKSLAMDLSRESGLILIDNLRRVKVTKIKDKLDFCTNIDIKVERFIIRGIHRAYPDHNILSEEAGDMKKESDYLWVIDPIDGTKHFMKNIPLFTVSIALQYKKEIVMGVIFNPSTHHMYHAYKGGGAYLNNRRIEVSKNNRIDHAFVALDISRLHHLPEIEMRNSLQRINRMLTETYRVRALGVSTLELCYLAQGAYDVYFDLTGSAKYVDVAAGLCIVKEAGGHVCDLEGKKVNRHTKHFLATNSRINKKIKDLLRI